VKGDGVAADRPLADAEIGRRGTPVDDRLTLQQLEECEEPGSWSRDASDSSTSADKN
jgi:hypothetical protein